jgi:endonuclease YncB( thermonuclease family)
VFGQQVIFQYDNLDYYGCILGKVVINGQDVNLRRVHDGLAWHYKYYQSDQSPADREAYSETEIGATRARAGLMGRRISNTARGLAQRRTIGHG